MLKAGKIKPGNKIRVAAEQVQERAAELYVGIMVYRPVVAALPEGGGHSLVGLKVLAGVDGEKVQGSSVGDKATGHVINGYAAAVVGRIRSFVAYKKDPDHAFFLLRYP